MRRRDFLALALVVAVSTAPRPAQSQPEMKLVGVLSVGTLDPRGQALFEAGLADKAWIVGENVDVVYQATGGDPDAITAGALELIARQPDVLYGLTTIWAQALAANTDSIPIVFSNVSDPIGAGLVDNLAEPGGLITGYTFAFETWMGKIVELLVQLLPDMEVAGFLYDTDTTIPVNLAALEDVAPRLGLDLTLLDVGAFDSYLNAIEAFGNNPRNGLIVDGSVLFWSEREEIVAAVDAVGVPAIYAWAEFVEAGGLISYGVDPLEPMGHAGAYVGRILNGEDPGSLPVQAGNDFILTLNLGAAARIGITFPTDLLATADEVIE